MTSTSGEATAIARAEFVFGGPATLEVLTADLQQAIIT
jgi:hypothetical protein